MTTTSCEFEEFRDLRDDDVPNHRHNEHNKCEHA